MKVKYQVKEFLMNRLMTATAITALTATAALAQVAIEEVDINGDEFVTYEEMSAFYPEFKITIYAAPNLDKDLESIFGGQLDRAYFPVQMEDMLAQIEFVDLDGSPVTIGDVTVDYEYTHHPGPTLGFKLAGGGMTLAFVPDNEFLKGYLGVPHAVRPGHEVLVNHEALLEFLTGVDVLNNRVALANGDGGAAYWQDSSNAAVTGGRWEGNHASGSGGAAMTTPPAARCSAISASTACRDASSSPAVGSSRSHSAPCGDSASRASASRRRCPRERSRTGSSAKAPAASRARAASIRSGVAASPLSPAQSPRLRRPDSAGASPSACPT